MQKTKPSTFRLKSEVISEIELLQKTLGVNKTEVLNIAVHTLLEKTLKSIKANPFKRFIGTINQEEVDGILTSVRQMREAQKIEELSKDEELERMFN